MTGLSRLGFSAVRLVCFPVSEAEKSKWTISSGTPANIIAERCRTS